MTSFEIENLEARYFMLQACNCKTALAREASVRTPMKSNKWQSYHKTVSTVSKWPSTDTHAVYLHQIIKIVLKADITLIPTVDHSVQTTNTNSPTHMFCLHACIACWQQTQKYTIYLKVDWLSYIRFSFVY